MALLNLKRWLAKKDIRAVLAPLLMDRPVWIQDQAGVTVLGEPWTEQPQRFAIALETETLGWVYGDATAEAIATLLSYLATKELEKKQLAQETLDRYKEITLLYSLAEKITANLELSAVADLVLEEAQKLIRGDSGAVILFNPQLQRFEQICTVGPGFAAADFALELGQGILGYVLETCVAEIVNEVPSDRRCIPMEKSFHSLVCAPLKSHDRVMGLVIIASTSPVTYSAADLKLLSVLASQAAAALENATLHENKLREERIKSNLERYVSPKLVQAIMESNGEIMLTPTRKEITVLFSDIRNFTTHCEQLEPEVIVGFLNEYFTHMVDVIFSHQGTVNKFVGDMIVALFGAPSALSHSEKQAIEAAIAMQQRLQVMPAEWIRTHFNTGIGISSGRVIVGNIGSPQHTDYTAIGDEVNTASRLQSLAKGGQILVSRSIYEATASLFTFRDVGMLQVKGKRNAVEVFEVMY